MNKTNIAVIGAGHLGKIHAKLLKTIEGVNPFVVETSEAARQTIESQFGIPTFETVNGIGEKLDGAIVVTPTESHHDVATRLIERGCHLFVEKPLCADAASSKELCELAERHGRVLQVGHVERFNPAFVAGRKHVREPRFIECTRFTPYTFRATDASVVLDLMIHDIDLVLSVVRSKVRSVQATGQVLIGPHHDVATAWLDFENGTKACLKASRCSSHADRSMNLDQSDGRVMVDFAKGAVSTMFAVPEISQRLDSLSQEQKQIAKDEMFEKWLPVKPVHFEPQNAILEEQKEFLRCIQGEEFPTVSGRDGLAAVEVAEQILAAMDAPAAITLEEAA